MQDEGQQHREHPQRTGVEPVHEPDEQGAGQQAPVAQLANTGPPELVLAFFGAGLFLVGYGMVLLNLDAAAPALAWARSRGRSRI